MSKIQTMCDSRVVVPASFGYGILAIAGWMGGMVDVGWYARSYVHGAEVTMAAGVALAVMGTIALVSRQTLDSLVFYASAVSVWTFQAAADAAAAAATKLTVSLPTGEPLSYEGWYFATWLILFVPLWLSSFRAGALRQLFLLGTVLAYAGSAVGCWFAIAPLQPIVGYISLVTAAIAASIVCTELKVFWWVESPNEDSGLQGSSGQGLP